VKHDVNGPAPLIGQVALVTGCSRRGGIGHAIAAAMGATRLCILRNHGLLTGGASPGEAVGLFVLAERVAEVHVKAADPQPISDDAAKYAAVALGCDTIGWRVFQWLARDLVPDPSVVLGG
jgi:ribulose-5-phosphate 4-epimerase/fuculose-1-phosphate aldolase